MSSAEPAFPTDKPPFVLVHGAWHGGWCWRHVAARLRQAGHTVFTPTCTGLGERAHLLSAEITVDTFADDVAGVIACEELDDVVLVGHSFAGLVISLLADRMPERLRHLVYLDAAVVGNHESAFNSLAPDVVEKRRQRALAFSDGLSLPPPPASAFGVLDPADAAWIERRLTPQPFGTFTSPVVLRHPLGNGLPRTYVACADPAYAPFEELKAALKRQPGWAWRTLVTGHDAMVSAPDAVAGLLLDLATPAQV